MKAVLPVITLRTFCRHGWWIAALLLCAASWAIAFDRDSAAQNELHFSTLPPHAVLPTDAQCAKLVARSPETRPANEQANHTMPTAVQLDEFHAHPVIGTNPPASDFARVDGAYTGSTEMILRWAACKWGVDEEVVMAQAWAESKWIQGGANSANGGGDKRLERAECVRDGFTALWNYECPGCCFQSWGILQTKVYYAPSTWPMIKDSTSFNADYRYAEERACLNGDYREYFASAAQQPNTYSMDIASGDLNRVLWGCTGMHFSGSWYDSAAIHYIQEIKGYIITRPWNIR
jgi:hypothetical protein